MEAFELSEVISQRQRIDRSYLEFLRAPSLSAGLYSLGVGDRDLQTPHTEDEIYFVVSGRAVIRVAEEDRPVTAGSIVYVDAGVEHRFHTIEEDLTLLVIFRRQRDLGKARTSRKQLKLAIGLAIMLSRCDRC